MIVKASHFGLFNRTNRRMGFRFRWADAQSYEYKPITVGSTFIADLSSLAIPDGMEVWFDARWTNAVWRTGTKLIYDPKGLTYVLKADGNMGQGWKFVHPPVQP